MFMKGIGLDALKPVGTVLDEVGKNAGQVMPEQR